MYFSHRWEVNLPSSDLSEVWGKDEAPCDRLSARKWPLSQEIMCFSQMPFYDIQALALGSVWASLFSPPDTFREREHGGTCLGFWDIRQQKERGRWSCSSVMEATLSVIPTLKSVMSPARCQKRSRIFTDLYGTWLAHLTCPTFCPLGWLQGETSNNHKNSSLGKYGLQKEELRAPGTSGLSPATAAF